MAGRSPLPRQRSQNSAGVSWRRSSSSSSPKRIGQRHHDDVVLLDELVGQVAGTVGDDVDAGHARVCHGGAVRPREGARRAGAAIRRRPRSGGSNPACRDDATRRVEPGGPSGRTGPRGAVGAGWGRPGRDGGRRCVSWRRPSQITTAPKVRPPATTEPTTRASRPATVVDAERLDTTSTTIAHGDGGDDDADQRRPGLALGQAAEPLVEDGAVPAAPPRCRRWRVTGRGRARRADGRAAGPGRCSGRSPRGRGRRRPWSAASTAAPARSRGRRRSRAGPRANMASAAPVVAVSAGVLCPMPSRGPRPGWARSSMPTADGMMRARTARRPPVMRCRNAGLLPGGPALRPGRASRPTSR